jgi:hypothetical protein
VNINTFSSNAMSKKPRNRTAGKSDGLIDALSPDERQRVAALFATLNQSIAEHRHLLHGHAAIVADVELLRDQLAETMPRAVRKELAMEFDKLVPKPIDMDRQPRTQLVRLAMRQIRSAAEMGFVIAVVRYRKWLAGNREVEAILRGREDGQRRGHVTQSHRSDELAKEIRDTWASMEAAGERVTNGTVAAAVGCSTSTVIRAFKNKPSKRARR